MTFEPRRAWIHPIRFGIQVLVLVGCMIGLITSKQVSNWLLPTTLVVGVLFCGWVCPLGSIQDWLFWFGRKLKLPVLRMPAGVQRYLQLTRYALYLLTLLNITVNCLHGTRHVGKLLRGDTVGAAALGVLIAFLLVSLFFKRPFCNYACVGGARRGLLSVLRLIGIRRDEDTCVHCNQCTTACPMNIDVANQTFVRHPNCIGCLTCLTTCPKQALTFKPQPIRKK